MSIQIGYIENITGDATVTSANGTTADLTQNTALSENDIITTGTNATVIVTLNDGSSITVGPNQSMTLDKTVHDSEELSQDETQAEVDSLKAILAESPDLSVFEETASGETVAVGGSSVTVDSFVHHNENLGDASSTMLENVVSATPTPYEEDDRFGLPADDTPVIITLSNILTNDNTPTVSGTVNDPEAQIVITVDGNDYTATNNGDGTWTLPSTDPISDGDTVITVVATDPAGNTTTETATITVDTVAPTVTVDTTPTNDTTPTISGTTNDPDANIVVTIDGNDYTATNNGDGTWTVPSTNILPEGDTAVTVVATDPAGNTTTVNDSITIDTTPPAVTINDLVTNDTTPAITGTTDDATATIVVTVGGSDYTAVNNGNGTWTLADDTITTLTPGENTILVTATDPAGNTSTATTTTGSITIDTTAPTVTINDLITNDTTPAISGTTDDATAIIVVTVGGSDYTAINNGNGTWTLADDTITALTPGENTILVTATDPAGNASTATTTTGSITIDTTAPAVTIDDLVTSDTTPAITGTTDDDSATIVVTVGGSDYTATNNGDGTWTLADDTVAALPTGEVAIVVTATDTVGNESTASTTTGAITIDTTAPTVTVDEMQPTNDTTPTITGTTNDTTSTIVVTVGGNDYNATVNPDGTWSVTVTDVLPEQDNAITVVATDPSGNATTVNDTITIDTTPPSVSIDSLNTNDTTPTITGTTDDAAAIIVVTVNGTDYNAVNNGDGTWSMTIPDADLLAENSYDVSVTATDLAGNDTTATAIITIDTTLIDADSDNGGNVVTIDSITDDNGEFNNDFITNDTTLIIRGTYDNESDNSLQVLIDGVEQTVIITGKTWEVDYQGTVLQDGEHSIVAIVTDDAGNVVSQTQTTLIDTDASGNDGNGNTVSGADATITLHEVSDNFINLTETGQDLVITGTSTAKEGSAVTIEITGQDGIAHNINEFLDPDPVIEVDASGNFSVTFVATAFSLFADGDYTVTATVAADLAGNTVSDTQNVVLDTTLGAGDINGDVVTIDTIDDINGSTDFSGGSVTTDDKTIIIRGTVNIESDSRFILTIDGVVYTPTVTGTNWELDLSTLPLSATTHEIIAQVVDNAGNTAEVTKDIIINPATGVLAIEAITDDTGLSGADFVTQDTSLIITGSMTDPVNNTLEITIDSTTYTVADTELTINPDGTWSLDLTDPAHELAVDGSYTLSVSEIDGATTTTITQEITTDNTGPADTNNSNGGNVVTIDSITDDTGLVGDFITTDTSLLIAGTFDNENGNSLSVTINGNPYDVTINGNDWSIDLQNTPFSDGTYTITATVTDTAGNQVSQEQIIDVDTRNDDIGDATILLDPISDNYINLGETTSNNLVSITGSTTAANGTVVSVYVEGTLFSTTTAQDGLFSLDIPKDTFTTYPDGAYVVTAEVAADAAGNIASDSQTVFLDTSVTDTTGGNGIGGADATVTLDEISDNTIDYAETQDGITITGTTTLLAGGEVIIELNGETYLTTATGANSTTTPNTFSVTIPATDLAVLPNGTYTATATVVADKAGNTVVAAEDVIVDTDQTTNLTFMVDTSSSMNDIVNITNEYSDTIFSFFFFGGTTRDITVQGNEGDSISFYNNGEIVSLGTIGASGEETITLDFSTFFFFTFGSYEVKVGESRLDLTKDAINNTITEYALNGDVSVQLYDMNNPSIIIDSSDLTAVQAEIDALTADGGTDYDLATDTVIQDSTLTTATDNQIYFITDGGDTLSDQTAWQNYVDSINAEVNAIGIGDSVTQADLDEIESTPTIVADTNLLSDTLISTISDGDDVLLYDANTIQNDGRIGTDTLVLDSADDLDFSSVSNIQNIESIDLVGGDHTITNLSAQDVIDMTDADNELFIYGDAGDSVALDTTLIGQGTTVTDSDGKVFDVFSDAGNTVTVNIEQEIIVS